MATAVDTALMQSLSIMHFQRALAAALPRLEMHVVQQAVLLRHSLSHCWRAIKQFLSFWQFCTWVEQCCWMHYWGVARAKAVEMTAPKQWFLSAHLAVSIAAWLPFPGRQNVQQLLLVPHFFWQSCKAGMHLESFWQAAHSFGHFSSMHCWGSLSAIAVEISVAFKQLFFRMQLK